MQHAAETLDALKIGYEAKIVSAHRTPKRLYEFAQGARKEPASRSSSPAPAAPRICPA